MRIVKLHTAEKACYICEGHFQVLFTSIAITISILMFPSKLS